MINLFERQAHEFLLAVQADEIGRKGKRRGQLRLCPDPQTGRSGPAPKSRPNDPVILIAEIKLPLSFLLKL